MGKKLGPKHKFCRRVGEPLCGLEKCPSKRRGYPSGVHGPTRKSKLTDYGIQLLEKQKAKFIYGIMERQLKKYLEKAQKKKGNTEEIIMQMLECRLDNVVYRLGFAKTRHQAREMVSHGHFMVNDKNINIPSYQVRQGDIIKVHPLSLKLKLFSELSSVLEGYKTPSWLSLDFKNLSGKVLNLPSGEELKQNFNPKLIIEFYSR